MTPTVHAVMHTDVRGKQQYYLKISAKDKPDYIVNVGEKTFLTVKQMEDEPAQMVDSSPVRESGNGRTNNRKGE